MSRVISFALIVLYIAKGQTLHFTFETDYLVFDIAKYIFYVDRYMTITDGLHNIFSMGYESIQDESTRLYLIIIRHWIL